MESEHLYTQTTHAARQREVAGTSSAALHLHQCLYWPVTCETTHTTGYGSTAVDVPPLFINYSYHSLYLITFYEREAQLDE